MLSKPLITYANCYNFNVLEDYAYGQISNYLVSVTNNGYKKIAFISFFAFENEEDGENLLKYKLSDEIKKLQLAALKDYEISEDGVLIRTGEDLKSFDEAVLAVCNILQNCGIAGTSQCSYCGADTNDDMYVYFDGTKALLYCKECATDYFTEKSKNDTKAESPKKSIGTVVSLASGIVGLLISLVLFAFVIPFDGIKDADGNVLIKSMLLCMPLSAIVSVITFVAYRLVTGKKGAERLVPCSIISIVSSILLTYSASAILYTKMFDIGFSTAFSVLDIILLAPFTDSPLRKDFLMFTLYSFLTVVVVALIYAIVFEDKKKPKAFLVKYGDTEALSAPEGEHENDDINE